MPWYIVTVDAQPMAGVALTIPGCVFSDECSDQRGAQHSVLVDGEDLDALQRSTLRIARIELVSQRIIDIIKKSGS